MIKLDELRKIANLAKLSLEEDDTEALARDITSILEFANTISEAVVDLPKEEETSGGWNLRDDVVEPSYPPEDILLNAVESQGTYIKARKMGGTVL